MKKKLVVLLVFLISIFSLIIPVNAYAASKGTYTVKYYLYGGVNNKYNPVSYTKKTKTITLKNPVKNGYIFSGWYSDTKLKKKVTQIKKGTKKNTVLYAKWTPITYAITYNANGGTGKMAASTKIKYDTKFKLSKNAFIKKGYNFVGWTLNKNGKGVVYANKQVIKNLTNVNKKVVTLYAKWEKKETLSQKNAVKTAKSYLKFTSFSYQSLYDQLIYEKFSPADAKYGVDNCGAGWYDQAVKSAKSYLRSGDFSYQRLIEQLKFEKFTDKQAVYGADNSGGKWYAEALDCAKSYMKIFNYSYDRLVEQLKYEKFTDKQVKYAADTIFYGDSNSVTTKPVTVTKNDKALERAKSYLSVLNFSYEGLIEQLEYEGYTTGEATYAANNCGANWNSQALGKAKSYLSVLNFSYQGLIDQLEFDKFTHAQAVYAVNNCGANWNEQAAKKAKSYMSIFSYSYSELVSQLEFEGFTYAQAVYGADNYYYY